MITSNDRPVRERSFSTNLTKNFTTKDLVNLKVVWSKVFVNIYLTEEAIAQVLSQSREDVVTELTKEFFSLDESQQSFARVTLDAVRAEGFNADEYIQYLNRTVGGDYLISPAPKANSNQSKSLAKRLEAKYSRKALTALVIIWFEVFFNKKVTAAQVEAAADATRTRQQLTQIYVALDPKQRELADMTLARVLTNRFSTPEFYAYLDAEGKASYLLKQEDFI